MSLVRALASRVCLLVAVGSSAGCGGTTEGALPPDRNALGGTPGSNETDGIPASEDTGGTSASSNDGCVVTDLTEGPMTYTSTPRRAR